MASTKHLLLVGAGNMGAALARGILEQSDSEWSLTVVDPNSPYKEELNSFETCEVVTELSSDPGSQKYHATMLAIKPQFSEDVLPSVAKHLSPEGYLISVMAGKSVASIQRDLGIELPVVRAMPNLPAQVGMSMTTVYCSQSVNETQSDEVRALLQTVGAVIEVESEELVDAATAIAGSGPGFLYHLLSAAEEQAKALGFTEAQAKTLLSQTILGSLKLGMESKESYQELERRVTSPNGTTEAGIGVLKDGKVQEAVKECLKAAFNRAQELSS